MNYSVNLKKAIVTPVLQKQLCEQLNMRFQSKIDHVLQHWQKNQDFYGALPKEEQLRAILYAGRTINCDHALINGLCQLLLGLPYRNHVVQVIPSDLKRVIQDSFYEQFAAQKGVSWSKFNQAWGEKFNDHQPPSRPCLEKFFKNEHRNACEHWIIDGLCQLLLDCSFAEWSGLNSQVSGALRIINPPELDSGEIRWVGRELALQTLKNKLIDSAQDCRLVSIIGLTGVGKTSLAARLWVDEQIQDRYPVKKVVYFDSEEANFDLITKTLLGEQALPSQGSSQNFHTHSLLTNLQDPITPLVGFLRSRSYLVILDMMEETLTCDQQGNCCFRDQRLQDFFDAIIKAPDFASRILITSQDKLPTFIDGRYPHRQEQTLLNGLTMNEALDLFHQWEIYANSLEEKESLHRLITVYEGHPLALRVIAGEIRSSPYDGEISAYWYDFSSEIEAVENLKNAPDHRGASDHPELDRYSANLRILVKSRIEKSFTRLVNSYPLAAELLSMGAVYRRPVERQGWLTMIAEYDGDAQKMAFNTLLSRCLLEVEKSKGKTLYHLHGLIRRIALEHLSQL